MRIQISIIQAPFVPNPIEPEAAALRRALMDAGHSATVVRVPFQGHTEALAVDHLLASRLLAVPSVEEPNDLMIALELPAALVNHPSKVLWLAPLERLFTTPDGNIEIGPVVHGLLRDLSREVIAEARAVYAASPEAAVQCRRWIGVDAGLCFPPAVAQRHRAEASPGAHAASWANVVERLLE